MSYQHVQTSEQSEIDRLRLQLQLLEQKAATVEQLRSQLSCSEQRHENTQTQLQAAQHKLIQSERLASLGTLVSGVAHEVNTPLGVSVTAASHLRQELNQLQQQVANNQLSRQQLDEFIAVLNDSSTILQHNLQRASELVKGFKQVAVDQSSKACRQINLQEHLQEIMLSLSSTLKQHNINLELNLQPLIWTTRPGAISQVITNLVMNSIMHGLNGTAPLTISISSQSHSEHLTLLYSDNGLGMDRAVCQRIFEPFFTTKRNQGGSGLGLSIIFDIVTKTLKGTISCWSEPDKGTQFELTLPW